MNTNELEAIIEQLCQKGIVFEAGLTDAEVTSVQEKFGFLFPPDLRLFLQLALPVGESLEDAPFSDRKKPFPNWRYINEEKLREEMSWPLEGVLFDVEHNQFWFSGWGVRPDALEEALHIAEQQFAAVPKLIPVFGHRYIPESPHEVGNPIFSVWQTDVVYYGVNLADYLHREFLDADFKNFTILRQIPFWSFLAEG